MKCPRCFWLIKHGVQKPDTYPYALNNAVDSLLKAKSDIYRSKGELPPLFKESGISGRLFPDLEKMNEWRANRQGVRWEDPETGYTFNGAIDDLLELSDGSLSVVDYKASGAQEATVYPDYQLQVDFYTFLLQKLGYKTAPKAFFAFFMAVKKGEFQGHLAFQGVVKEVQVNPGRIYGILKEAISNTQTDVAPSSGENCDRCRWFRETQSTLRDK